MNIGIVTEKGTSPWNLSLGTTITGNKNSSETEILNSPVALIG